MWPIVDTNRWEGFRITAFTAESQSPPGYQLTEQVPLPLMWSAAKKNCCRRCSNPGKPSNYQTLPPMAAPNQWLCCSKLLEFRITNHWALGLIWRFLLHISGRVFSRSQHGTSSPAPIWISMFADYGWGQRARPSYFKNHKTAQIAIWVWVKIGYPN